MLDAWWGVWAFPEHLDGLTGSGSAGVTGLALRHHLAASSDERMYLMLVSRLLGLTPGLIEQ